MHRNLLLCRLTLSACLLLLFIEPVIAQRDAEKTRKALATDSRIKSFIIDEQTGTISSIYFKEKTGLRSSDAVTVIRSYFELAAGSNEIQREQLTELANGIQVEKFEHYFKSIPVEHSSYMITSRNGEIISLNAESCILLEAFNVQPGFSEEQALDKALGFVKAKKYMWEALEEDKAKAGGNPALQQKLEQLRQEHSPVGKLVISKDIYGDGQPKLAWKFDIYAAEPLGRYHIYIDAMDGRLLLRDMIIKHVDEEKKNKGSKELIAGKKETPFLPVARQTPSWKWTPTRITSETGTAHTRYAGIRAIQTTRVSVPLMGMPDPNNPSVLLSYSGVDPRIPIVAAEQVFILKDDTRGNGIETYDMNGVGGVPLSLPGLHAQSLAFVDRDVLPGSQNVWKNEGAGTNEDHLRGATSNGSVGADEATNDDFALDAHWGAEVVYDYWKNVHNRFSFDNRNSAIKSYVHYGPAYDNAFWNGSVMTYGDGSGTSAAGFRPLTSLDVCGHEIGHGVCSFTSDLVYEKESGAMNEALSDIWAAAVERYAIVNVAPELLGTYQPFSIGEQIGTSPLRRMDNPKLSGNPDTYGGINWSNPNCTPTLANDYCGVHNNSGVLNKWFYLLTVGSTTGSGPDASYSVPGADDGLADNGPIPDVIPYAVTGIGFSKSEAITYLMELLLTPTATFMNARTASITAARILYGECSAEEISVTNAWHAVGVGAAYTSCALPVISVQALLTDVKETAGGLLCERYNEYNMNVNLTVAQAIPVTVNFAIGATTLSADEYSLSATSVTYNPGETGLRIVKLRIYDDAMVEADETLDLNVTASNPALNQLITFTVRNDDIHPVLGGTVTLLNENFESFTEGGLGAPGTSTWGKIDKIPGNIQWAVRTDGSVPSPISFTTKRAIIEQTAPIAIPGEALYDQLTDGHTILRAPLIDATGLNSIRVQFTYQAGGEPACEPACDYAQLLYSYDGTNFSPFFDLQPLFLSFTDASFDFTLPASFNGKQFYLGLQWYNDALAGTSGSVTIDNFIVTARGRAIETELGDAVTEKVNAETGKPSYFYSTADAEIISRISNSQSNNYGCVTNFIERAGTSGFILYQNGIHVHRVADKIIRVNAAINPSGNYNISFYLTEQEILGLESFAGNTRFNMFIYKTSASAYTGAANNNTNRVSATYTAIPGLGGRFSANFTNGFNGSYAIGTSIQGIPLPVTCTEFSGMKEGQAVKLNWKVEDEIDNHGFEIERSTDGVNYSFIGRVDADQFAGGRYRFTDPNITGVRDVFYRLKQIDLSGEYRFVCSILRLRMDASFSLGNIYPNPGRTDAFVNLYTEKPMQLRIDYINTNGQQVASQTEMLQAGASRIQLKMSAPASGVYIVQFRDQNGELLGTQRYTRTH